jgi:hypothetical protein
MVQQIPVRTRGILTAAFGVALAILVLLCYHLGRGAFWVSSASPANDQRDALPLRFQSTSVDLRDLVAKDYGQIWTEVKFSFTVWDQGPVSITSIIPDCPQCMHFDKEIVGKQLHPGSTHVLSGRVKPSDTQGRHVSRALVETAPPSPKPLVLDMKYHAITRPGISPPEVALETSLGSKPIAQLHVTAVRQRAAPQLQINREASSFPGFTLVNVESKSAVRRLDPRELDPNFLDEIDLTIQAAKDYDLGVHHTQWVIKWEGPVPATVVPVTIRVVHPIVPKLQSVFCGILHPKETWKGTVLLVQVARDKSSLKQVRASKPFIQAVVGGTPADQLQVSLTTPSTPGRHEEYLEMVFEQDRIPPLRIPITFVVQE